ncbi:MAG: penicillin-binding protein activator [Sulfuricellaceae bacterium]
MLRLASFFIILLSLWNGGLTAQADEGRASSNRHIALLLPLQSEVFGRAADAFQQGFMTAAEFQPDLPVIVYPTSDRTADIVTAYRQLTQADAALVVGPLTRGAVTALLNGPLPLPTIALNTPENRQTLPENLYLFNLNVDSEARQVARLAYSAERKTALTVTATNPLAYRIQGAFADEWQKLGGAIVERLSFAPNQGGYPKLRAAIARTSADVLFLAADASNARIVRPYLDSTIPTYATSLVYSSNGETGRNLDLNQIRFVEMPWFLLHDNPTVMAYPRPANPMRIELERFYALGIDAYRLAVRMLTGVKPVEPLDGVTGQITLDGQQYTRELTAAQFHRGEAVATRAAP